MLADRDDLSDEEAERRSGRRRGLSPTPTRQRAAATPSTSPSFYRHKAENAESIKLHAESILAGVTSEAHQRSTCEAVRKANERVAAANAKASERANYIGRRRALLSSSLRDPPRE